jgi:hypothetical protein
VSPAGRQDSTSGGAARPARVGQKGTVADVGSNGRSGIKIGRPYKRPAPHAPRIIVITNPFLNLFLRGRSIFLGMRQ